MPHIHTFNDRPGMNQPADTGDLGDDGCNPVATTRWEPAVPAGQA